MIDIKRLEEIDDLQNGTRVFGGPFRASVIRRWTPPPDPDTGETFPDMAEIRAQDRTIIWETAKPAAQSGVTADINIVEGVVRSRGEVKFLRCYGLTAIEAAGIVLPDLPPPTPPGTALERLERVEKILKDIHAVIERDLL